MKGFGRMKFGLTSGLLWGLDTVVLGIGLSMSPFIGTAEAIAFAAIASAALHDIFCAIDRCEQPYADGPASLLAVVRRDEHDDTQRHHARKERMDEQINSAGPSSPIDFSATWGYAPFALTRRSRARFS